MQDLQIGEKSLNDSAIDDRLIDMKYMQSNSGFTAKFFYSQIKAGKLPAPMKFERCSRWWLSDYQKWKNSHVSKMRA
jgi:predicted DNA-binding transcriptional regulator AlpA